MFEYRCDVVDGDFIEKIAAEFQRAVQAGVANPDRSLQE
jgi:hypothetical protein